MKQIFFGLYLFCTGILFNSCHAQFPVNLNGVWIPEKINWKEGSYYTLYFYDDSSFLRIASTQHKVAKDSIEFMTEPGFVIEYGTISNIDNKNTFAVTYRILQRTFPIADEKMPGDQVVKNLTVIKGNKDQSSISFDGENYTMTRLYTQDSQERIKALATNLVPRLLKTYKISK